MIDLDVLRRAERRGAVTESSTQSKHMTRGRGADFISKVRKLMEAVWYFFGVSDFFKKKRKKEEEKKKTTSAMKWELT